jgi:hypothetical protein
MIIKIRRDPGFAAYVDMNGCELISFQDDIFEYESDKDINDWRVQYNKSCCLQHDLKVCELRKFLSPNRKYNNNKIPK